MANGQLEDWEIELIGDVKNFCPIIKEVADELHIPDYAIKAELVNPDEANFAYFNIFSVERRNPSPTLIGVLTLKSRHYTNNSPNTSSLTVESENSWSR